MTVDTLISSSVQGGVVALLVWFAVRFLPSLTPAARVWLWRLVFLKFALGLFGVGQVTLHVLPSHPALQPPVAAYYVVSTVPAQAMLTTPATRSIDYLHLLSILWIVGASVVGLFGFAATWR